MRNGGSFRTVLIVAVALLFSSGASASPRALFRPADGPPGGVHVPRQRFVHVDSSLLDSGETVELNLFDDLVREPRSIRVNPRKNGLVSWSSAIENDRFGYALFVVNGGRVTGQIEADGTVYEIRPVDRGEDGVHEIRELDPNDLPQEAEPLLSASAGLAPVRFARSVQRDAIDSIRVLVVYTAAAAAASTDIEAEAQLAVDAANTAYQNSNMATRLVLVATAETPYVENGDIYDDLDHLENPWDGEMDEVHSLRNAYLADFVSLLVDVNPGYCGLANLMQGVSPSFEDQAFSVTYLPCAVGNLTLAHEIGHNMGCQHDRDNATSDPAYSWAYGYQDPTGDFRTVMAVAAGCRGDCPRVAHFANPGVTYLGEPTGVDASQTDAAACALAIDATSTVSCDFRTLEPPGALDASTTFTDRVRVWFEHPWPWSFQVYRAESGGPMVALEVTDDSPFDDTTAVPGTSYDYWVSTRTMLDGESEPIGPVAGARAIPDCGNSIKEWPAEECDDGNTAAGDGCDPYCKDEAPLEGVAADCVAKLNDRAIRVSKAQGKENLLCLSAAAAGKEPDADACIAADTRQKVEKARAKLASTDAALCMTPPPFGYEGATAAADAGEDERRGFLLDLFGADLSAAVLAKSTDAAGAGCQKAVAKAADKVLAAALAAFLTCKVDRIEDLEATAGESLEACYDHVASEAADDGSRLGMALERLATARVKKCAAANLAAAFPGVCAGASGDAFDACITAMAECRTCRMFDLADGFTRDCDLFDNGAPDSSCAP